MPSQGLMLIEHNSNVHIYGKQDVKLSEAVTTFEKEPTTINEFSAFECEILFTSPPLNVATLMI